MAFLLAPEILEALLFPTADLGVMEKLFETDAGILFQLVMFKENKEVRSYNEVQDLTLLYKQFSASD